MYLSTTTGWVWIMSDEPSDAQKLIAEVILRHQPNEWGQHDGWWECCCQHGGPPVPWTPEHVAAEVDKALGGLTRQSGCDMSTKWLDGTRWVSGWTVTE